MNSKYKIGISRLICVLIRLMGLLPCMGQEMEDFSAVPFDLSASTNRRTDNNGKACALIKVLLSIEGASFEGNVIGNVSYDSGEYWVYISTGSKSLRIKHPRKRPLMVGFDDFGISIEGSQTYQRSVRTESEKDKPSGCL